MDKAKLTTDIKNKAFELGFFDCGISKADFLKEEAPRLEKWLKNDYHGTMSWMENHFEKRLDPRKLVEGAKSVISVALNYFPKEPQNSAAPKISKYAYGKDYHFVIKHKLKEMAKLIKERIGDCNMRVFVDSAPVMDRAWAEKSGIGWKGKHSLTLTKERGSFYFLGEIILDVELAYDGPTTDHCGSCTRCIDACPTDAIVEPYVIDAKQCISYLTIEYKEAIPSGFQSKMEDWVFGCDVCQDVCPWNRFAAPTEQAEFAPNEKMLVMNREEWHEITEELFREIFKNSAVKRTKYQGLKRNLDFIKPKSY